MLRKIIEMNLYISTVNHPDLGMFFTVLSYRYGYPGFESWHWYVTIKTIASPLKQFEELENLKIFENSNPIFDVSLESLICVLRPGPKCSSIWNREKKGSQEFRPKPSPCLYTRNKSQGIRVRIGPQYSLLYVKGDLIRMVLRRKLLRSKPV